MTYLLSLDQGTTSSRAIIFNENAKPIAMHQIDIHQTYPQDGWVEQDPEEIWKSSLECCQQVIKKSQLSASNIAAMGITNQRETTIIWDRKTGIPIYPAIVWQDRRTAELCDQFVRTDLNSVIQQKTGLMFDPYFSATKILWILQHVPGARTRAEQGELAFGTVDSFLLWRFTSGKSHFTDATNASRTLLYNLAANCWDDDIINALNIPKNLLPSVLDNVANFGTTDPCFLGVPLQVSAMIGDQQGATVGQGCFSPGMVKATYGTGAFMLLNTGSEIVISKNKLLSTVAFRINGKSIYGLEGSIFSAGMIIKWLRDSLKLIKHSSESELLAKRIASTDGVYLVPAFTGLGAPYWNPHARAALFGLKGNSGVEQIVRAALEAVCYQTRDLFECMLSDGVPKIETLRVDGGMSINNWLLQFLSDILNLNVQRPVCIESSALGAAFLAGLQQGVFSSLENIAEHCESDASFQPHMLENERKQLYNGWKNAVERIII